jgi:hypothetical protein
LYPNDPNTKNKINKLKTDDFFGLKFFGIKQVFMDQNAENLVLKNDGTDPNRINLFSQSRRTDG